MCVTEGEGLGGCVVCQDVASLGVWHPVKMFRLSPFCNLEIRLFLAVQLECGPGICLPNTTVYFWMVVSEQYLKLRSHMLNR